MCFLWAVPKSSISVTVPHVQNIGIIRAFYLRGEGGLLCFSVPHQGRKNWFVLLGRTSTQAVTMPLIELHNKII